MVDAVGASGAAVADPERIARRFAARVGRIGTVARVVALPLLEGMSVWTMLDGDSGGQARRSVYDAQFSTLRRHLGVPLSFRVVDAAEFPPEWRNSLLPADARLLFDRKQAAQGAHRPGDHAE